MSYDVAVFFGEKEPSDLTSAIEVTRQITGWTFTGTSSPPASLFGMTFDLHPRPPFLQDNAEMPFSAFSYQLDLACPTGRLSLIHPLGLFLTEEYSRRLAERAMLCLAGVEFLGAIFNHGRMTVDRMASHQNLYAGSRWRYQSEDR